MAEAALYDFHEDQVFPYALAAKHLNWVPEYITTLTPDRITDPHLYGDLLNVLLVFSRARTATFTGQIKSSAEILPRFIQKLNAVLDLVPGGDRHVLEIFRYERQNWFITSKYSPRFIWKRHLTHRQVGLNLDYYASGHLGRHKEARATVHWVETSRPTLYQVFAEVVNLDYIPDLSALKSFNDRKENLINSSMARLGLPYRFQWFWQSAVSQHEFSTMMKSRHPPPREWWEKNYYAVNFPTTVRLLCFPPIAFCSIDSRYAEFWPFVQEIHDWTSKYKVLDCDASPEQLSPYLGELEALFSLIYSVLLGEKDGDKQAMLEIKRRMTTLEEFHARLCEIRDPSYKRKDVLLKYEPILLHLYYRCVDLVKFHVTQRWRQHPRKANLVPYPLEDGDMILRSLWRVKLFDNLQSLRKRSRAKL
jgi:hypothetical protein